MTAPRALRCWLVMRSCARLAAPAALLALVFAVPGSAAAASGEHAAVADPNPWPQQRFLNMAHAGGENEAPANTMYAFKRAVTLGADMIELDVQATADDKLV